ncbi:hypothetical protein BLNAU_2016 [Blattamonas nauphoetae]|uniref:Protein kinase domain-containing protein n=1 Tax=Blattamonas nauphoetae TaxID=2049346 RepID=A0ABQ9YGZ3_9EUKA|nr:hypothetical protein BLNAU_2016 [Blattamonas nauphoetae]
MLGCVVSLTSSHLSGSTIRDVNTGGSVLCSNSSFSSLLSSPNTDSNEEPSEATATNPVDSTPEKFQDTKLYSFTNTSGTTSSSAIFSHCCFTGDNYQPSDRPLSFLEYPGTISILSCSFDNITYPVPAGDGGAVFVSNAALTTPSHYTIDSSNFTSCSAANSGGAVWLRVNDDSVITSCRFENCSTTENGSYGAGLFLFTSNYYATSVMQLKLVDCAFKDCVTAGSGAGVSAAEMVDVSVMNTMFEHCETLPNYHGAIGSGIYVNGPSVLTVEGSHFIECKSAQAGGAIGCVDLEKVNISDTLVKDCYSGTTGAIFVDDYHGDFVHLSFSHVFFDGNSIGDDTTFFTESMLFVGKADKFVDVAIISSNFSASTTPQFEGCFTTVSSDSIGMIKRGKLDTSGEFFVFPHERYLDVDFVPFGPLLTAKPIARVNDKTGKIELEMKGSTPVTSQEFEVIVQNKNGTTTRLRMLFSDGTGTLVSGSESSLEYNTSYTITQIVGIVPDSSSSRMTNDFEVPVAVWVFNLAATPDLLTFTTPKPPFFISATANLISDDTKYAHVLLSFDEKVKGSFDIVVLEGEKNVTITVSILTEALAGESPKFVVVGDDRLLTQDTTYTIKSIVPTPNTDSPFVFMNDAITFHIPKSSYVIPEDPTEPEPEEPEPEDPTDPEDPKKALSPETKKLLSWLIPLVGCVLIALLLAIFIVVLVRRRQKKNAEPAQKELEVQEPIEVEKVEEFGVDCSNGVILTDENGQQTSNSPKENRPENKKTFQLNESQFGEVMACSGDFELSTARMDQTLYSVLHKEHREIGKRGIEIQIVNGLRHVVTTRGWSDVITRLSSHWILIDTAGNVRLKLQMNASEADQEATRARMLTPHPLPTFERNTNQLAEMTQEAPTDKTGMDGMRWRAPEVVAAEGGNGVESVDGHKASVFSLGLVLWEIETGQVPFGELDAVNAQRQSGTGIGPKMDTLKNEEFVSLIHRCLSVDPKHRPTLSEIGEFISSQPEDTQKAF